MKEHGDFGPIEVTAEELEAIKRNPPRLYTLAEVRERERCAWMNHGEWLYQTLAMTGRLPSRDEAEAEAKRRYGGEA